MHAYYLETKGKKKDSCSLAHTPSNGCSTIQHSDCYLISQQKHLLPSGVRAKRCRLLTKSIFLTHKSEHSISTKFVVCLPHSTYTPNNQKMNRDSH